MSFDCICNIIYYVIKSFGIVNWVNDTKSQAAEVSYVFVGGWRLRWLNSSFFPLSTWMYHLLAVVRKVIIQARAVKLTSYLYIHEWETERERINALVGASFIVYPWKLALIFFLCTKKSIYKCNTFTI